ncbi:MAG: hypothetical protein H6R46_855 [Proteobacteria bacterium]|nr:hypothetical protein [Pseudomonadota bacterium]
MTNSESKPAQKDPHVSESKPAQSPLRQQRRLEKYPYALARYAGQAVAYAAFAALLAFFATAPAYHPIDPDAAMIKLSFIHVGQRKVECRKMSPDEIARLPPNMRLTLDCPRERLPVLVELELDGKLLLRRELAASGLSHDRASNIYQKFVVPPGRHVVTARLRDSARTEGFDYTRSTEVELKPRQNFVVDFHAAAGGFSFH